MKAKVSRAHISHNEVLQAGPGILLVQAFRIKVGKGGCSG